MGEERAALRFPALARPLTPSPSLLTRPLRNPFSTLSPAHDAHPDPKDPRRIPVAGSRPSLLQLRLPRPLGNPILISPFLGFLPRGESEFSRLYHGGYRSPVSISAPPFPLHPSTHPSPPSLALSFPFLSQTWGPPLPFLPARFSNGSCSLLCPQPSLPPVLHGFPVKESMHLYANHSLRYPFCRTTPKTQKFFISHPQKMNF